MTRPTVGKGLEAKINNLIGEQAAWVRLLGVHPQTKTPNLDRLATIGVPFNKSHCAAPVCNPSRSALISGQSPSTTGCYDNAIACLWSDHGWTPGEKEH